MSQKITIGGHGGVGGNGYRAFAYAFNPDTHDYKGFSAFDALFEALIDGSIDKVVVPYENSIIGKTEPVQSVLHDLKARGLDLNEEGGFSIPIYHALIAGPSASKSKVKKVYSYALALDQCSGAIDDMGLERVEFEDAHAAVVHVVGRNRQDEAALGPIDAAEKLGAKILKDDMSNSENNMMQYKVFSLG
ncbi:MAG: prephenate dehydratase domain-containing protein [Pseudomonadota bacterium]